MTTTARATFALNVLAVSLTIVLVAVALVVGRAEAEPALQLEVGDLAPETFIATRFISVVDQAATQAARDSAAANTATEFAKEPFVDNNVRNDVRELFQSVRDVAFDPNAAPPEDIPVPTTQAPEVTTTVVPDTGVTTTTTEPPPTTTTTTQLPRRDLDDQIALVTAERGIHATVIPFLVEFHNADLDSEPVGQAVVFDDIEDETIRLIDEQLAEGIRSNEITAIRDRFAGQTQTVFISSVAAEDRAAVGLAIGDIIAISLQANEFVDEAQTQRNKDANVAAVEPVVKDFVASQPIVEAGERIDAVQLQAISDLGLLQPKSGNSRTAVAVLGGLVVLLTAFFLWRIAPSRWSRPKHLTLLGVLLVMAAAASRLPAVVAGDDVHVGYLIPAVMFGYLAAILYDPRTAVLMSLPVATFTAISTADPALTIYAAAATIAPVAFVSSVSSRRELRVAVSLSAIMLAPLAAAIAWLFTGPDTAAQAAVFALIGGTAAGLIAQGLLSSFENLFRVTTTITLLDLTDRNHEALRLIEEKAPGTFNHSVLVGTLAGKAARAIGADPLLAQAAAFYHDLGKTKEPHYFIENQFGVSNPHDDLDPVESAVLIRGHVTEGLRLAGSFKIPSDVAEGISMHHGTGLMRYFYHKALADDPGVDPADYRHVGTKPRRKEMAILMICDACEGAARALAQQEDPSADSLRKLVDSVVGEKLEDGQLDESDLTFGDLTRVKNAIVEALIGYYHTRIPYPGFPGPRAEDS